MQPEQARKRPSSPFDWRSVLSHDLPASLVVFLVALPLSMGIALASGASIYSGLIAAMIGGLVVGALGGAPLLVSGPAAGLAVMVFGFIQQLGFAVTCAAVVVAGGLQIAMGTVRVARVALAISPAVIHGMLAGIGVLIALAQLHVVLGGEPQSSALRNITELPAQIADLHGGATVLGLLTIALAVAWDHGPRLLRRVPAPLAAAVIVTAIASLARVDVPRVELEGSIWGALQLPTLPRGHWGEFAVAAVALAIVATAESLLSAVATDKLHTGPRARLDRELVAQGTANALSGLVGGLPVTGVIVRSSANVASGARSRASAFLHGVWLLLFVSQLGFIVTMVPLSVLAGLLVTVGAKLVKVSHIRHLVRSGEGTLYFATLAGVVGINLLAGILIGITLAILRLLWRLGRVRVFVNEVGSVYNVRIEGALTFVGVPHLTQALEAIPPGAEVKLELAVETIDHPGYEALSSWADTHRKLGGAVETRSLEERWRRQRRARRVSQVTPLRT